MIPKPIVEVVEAARKLIAARADLRAAVASKEVNEKGLAKRRKAVAEAVKALEKAVMALEERLAAAASRGAQRRGEPIPWGSVFKAATEFAGLVSRVRAADPTVLRDAAAWANKNGPGGKPRRAAADDIIDAELVD